MKKNDDIFFDFEERMNKRLEYQQKIINYIKNIADEYQGIQKITHYKDTNKIHNYLSNRYGTGKDYNYFNLHEIPIVAEKLFKITEYCRKITELEE